MFVEAYDKVGDTRTKRPASKPRAVRKPNTTSKTETQSVYLKELSGLMDSVSADTQAVVLSNLVVADEIKQFRLRLEE